MAKLTADEIYALRLEQEEKQRLKNLLQEEKKDKVRQEKLFADWRKMWADIGTNYCVQHLSGNIYHYDEELSHGNCLVYSTFDGKNKVMFLTGIA